MSQMMVLDKAITWYSRNDADYISLTDMARYRDEERVNYIVQNWMRLRDTIAFLGLWERLNNPDFKGVEFDAFMQQSGTNSFTLTPAQAGHLYASEADLLNVALFGMTASEWRSGNPDKHGNMRDYATAAQLVCLSNLENLNALFIRDGIPAPERLGRLNAMAIHQMTLLTTGTGVNQLELER